MIQLDESLIKSWVSESHLERFTNHINTAHNDLWDLSIHKEGKGWLNWPVANQEELCARVEDVASKFKALSTLTVVVGIGGSYLGAKSAISIAKSPFVTAKPGALQVVFAGHQLSAHYMAQLLALLDEYEVTLVVVSKSGSTLEPSVAFHTLRTYLEKRYGAEASNRICAITDPERGALRAYAEEKGYVTLPIPGDIGGRYSVLTAVGLLPMCLAGIDIRRVLAGAKRAHETFQEASIHNLSYRYALYRHVLYQKGFSIEALVTYEPSFGDFAGWWQQLYGESQGKDGIGVYPTMLQYTTDLHSMGQYVQDARKILFETVLDIQLGRNNAEILVPDNIDAANEYLKGHSFHHLQNIAVEAVMHAHAQAGVPNIRIIASGDVEEMFGELVQFFEISCAFGGYLLGINPFDQPGVEGYKQEIRRRLK